VNMTQGIRLHDVSKTVRDKILDILGASKMNDTVK